MNTGKQTDFASLCAKKEGGLPYSTVVETNVYGYSLLDNRHELEIDLEGKAEDCYTYLQRVEDVLANHTHLDEVSVRSIVRRVLPLSSGLMTKANQRMTIPELLHQSDNCHTIAILVDGKPLKRKDFSKALHGDSFVEHFCSCGQIFRSNWSEQIKEWVNDDILNHFAENRVDDGVFLCPCEETLYDTHELVDHLIAEHEGRVPELRYCQGNHASDFDCSKCKTLKVSLSLDVVSRVVKGETNPLIDALIHEFMSPEWAHPEKKLGCTCGFIGNTLQNHIEHVLGCQIARDHVGTSGEKELPAASFYHMQWPVCPWCAHILPGSYSKHTDYCHERKTFLEVKGIEGITEHDLLAIECAHVCDVTNEANVEAVREYVVQYSALWRMPHAQMFNLLPQSILDEVEMTCETIRTEIKRFNDQTKETIERILTFLTGPSLTAVLMNIGCAFLAYNRSQGTVLDMTILLGSALSAFPPVVKLIQDKIVDLASSLVEIFSWGNKNNENQAQSFEPIAVGSALGSLVAFVGKHVFDETPAISQLTKLIKTSVTLGTLARNITATVTGVKNLFLFLVEALYEWRHGVPRATEELKELITGFEEWANEVSLLRDTYDMPTIKKDKIYCDSVKAAYSRGMQLSKTIRKRGETHMEKAFDVHFRSIETLLTRVETNTIGVVGTHREPLVVLLGGPSGTGKSTSTPLLAKDLLLTMGIKVDDPTPYIYNRNVEQEYWDGYRFQPVTVYDDFGQLKDFAQQPNLEFMEIIRTANTSPMFCHMASLLDKANTPFSSQVVILTTNECDLRTASLNCPEALLRRIDLAFMVTKNDKWKGIDAMDFSRFTPYTPTGVKSPENTIIDVLNSDAKTLTYREMARMCGEKLLEKKQSFDAMQEISAKHDGKEYMPIPRRVEEVRESSDWDDIIVGDGIDEVDIPVLETLPIAQILDFGALRGAITPSPRRATWNSPTSLPNALIRLIKIMQSEGHTTPSFNTLWRAFRQERAKETLQGLMSLLTGGHWLSPSAGTALYECLNGSGTFDGKILALGSAVELTLLRENFSFREVSSMDSILVAWNDYKTKIYNCTRAFPERYPLLYTFCKVGLAVVTAGAGVYGLYSMSQKLSGDGIAESGTPLDHRHVGLKLGTRVKHYHACEQCGRVYGHSHIIGTEMESRQAGPHLCKGCATYSFGAEMAASGDPVTLKNAGRKIAAASVEMGHSGDPRTQKHKPELRFGNAEVGPRNYGDRNMKATADPAEMAASGDPKTKAARDREIVAGAVAQMPRDWTLHELLPVVSRNTYLLKVLDGEDVIGMAYGIMIGGKIMVTIGHLRERFQEGFVLRVANDHQTVDCAVEDIQVVRLKYDDNETKDVCFMHLGPNMPDSRDVGKYFLNSSDHSQFSQGSCVLLRGGGHVRQCNLSGHFHTSDAKRMYRDVVEGEEVIRYVRRNIVYDDIDTIIGDCGAPVTMVEPKTQARKILGIHIAGLNTGGGMAVPVYREEIDAVRQMFGATAQMCPVVNVKSDSIDTRNMPKGNFQVFGEGDKPVMPTDTKLRPSVIQGKVTPITTKPAKLGPFVNEQGERIDPLLKGLEKCAPANQQMNDDLIAEAANGVAQKIYNPRHSAYRRVLTDREMVEGVIGDDFVPPIKRSTSCGMPWMKTFKNGKKKLIDEDYNLHPALKAAIEERVELAKQGKRSHTEWVDTLKDERRPIAKVDAGKTRVFSNGPVDFSLAFRKYFLGFAAAMCYGRNHNEISVGTNVYSTDWQVIADHITSKGTNIVAGDFSSFDGTLQIKLLEKILDIINDWYGGTEEETMVRTTLWREIVNSVHNCRGNLYGWCKSQPSGCPITAILNSLYNSLAVRYVFLLLALKHAPSMASMIYFNKFVAMVAYGDDNLVGISDMIIEWFNQITMTEAFATFGMTYTDEAKSGKLVAFRGIEEVAYLKRKFRYEPRIGRYIAPLELGTCLEMVNWVRSSLDDVEQCKINCETSIFELALHGKDVYMEWAPRITKAFKEATGNCELFMPRWESLIDTRLGELAMIAGKTD